VGNAKDRSRGIDKLKNRSGKCKGPAGGGLDELENRSGLWEGPAEGGGVDGVKNRSGKWEGWGGLYGVYNTPVHYARGPH
jgi:hypothetical protein